MKIYYQARSIFEKYYSILQLAFLYTDTREFEIEPFSLLELGSYHLRNNIELIAINYKMIVNLPQQVYLLLEYIRFAGALSCSF